MFLDDYIIVFTIFHLPSRPIFRLAREQKRASKISRAFESRITKSNWRFELRLSFDNLFDRILARKFRKNNSMILFGYR